jgi:hypothetical protein
MDNICNITSNNYICAKKDVSSGINTYTIKSEEQRIANELMNTNYINFDISKSEISLTANSSNHYFWADERAHCSEKWQDWFCVPNYHNNNNVKKYPNSKTMSVGVCYTACPGGYTTSGINKCNLYEATNDDLIYNPLAIIALFGTHFYINYDQNDVLKNYKDIKDTIGIRGSYLNDLYRVNNNNKFITGEYVDVAKNTSETLPYKTAPTVNFAGGNPTTPATAKVIVIDSVISSIRMTSGGSGYTTAPTVSFGNVGKGTGAVLGTVSIDKRVSAVTIVTGAGGTGYASALTVVFSGGGGSGAYAIATVQDGVISKITVISGGSGYTSVPTVSFTEVGSSTAATYTSAATATADLETFVSNVEITNGGTDYTSDTTNQEKLLLKIINKFVNTGRDDATKKIGVKNATIKAIEADIKTASNNFITTYNIKKIADNDVKDVKLLNRIANYKFDINKLDKLYGKDKNGNRKLVNIIAYAYNIMHLLLYDNNVYLDTEVKVIDNNLTRLIDLTILDKDSKLKQTIKKVFTKAFINCFKVNFDLFNNYMKKHLYQDDVMRILSKTINFKFEETYFKKCEFKENSLDIVEPPYEIPYYNNLTFYDHRLLSEYSENTKYIIQILIIFGISLAIVLVVAGVYGCLIQLALNLNNYVKAKRFNILHKFTDFINYVFLFYNSFIFLIVKYTCVLYYFIFCSASKSNITLVYIVCNLLNLAFIIFLIGYSFASILELLNIDYVGLMFNIKLIEGRIEIPDVKYNGIFNKVIRYFVILYCIMIYLYCAYLVRYGLNESQYDILSNPDADFNISINYISNILLSQYSTDILSNINTIYTDEELAAAVNNKEVIKEIEKLKAAEEAKDNISGNQSSINVSGGDFGNANNVSDRLGDGNANNLGNMLNQGNGNGNGNVDLKNIDTSKIDASKIDASKIDASKIDLGALANGNTNSIEGQLQGKGNGNGNGNVDLTQLQDNPDMQDAMNNPDIQNAANKFGVSFG